MLSWVGLRFGGLGLGRVGSSWVGLGGGPPHPVCMVIGFQGRLRSSVSCILVHAMQQAGLILPQP